MPFIYTPMTGIREYTIIEKTESGKLVVRYGEGKAKCLSQIENISNSPEEAIADYYKEKSNEIVENIAQKTKEIKALEEELNDALKNEDYKKSKELFPEKFF